MQIKENIPLIPYTVFKIGGSADYFCEVKNKEDLVEAFNWAGEKSASWRMPFFVLGAGSNILFSDDGFRGLVIKMDLQGLKVVPTQGWDVENKIFASSGVSMARAVNFATEHGFGGFEWGIGIPGTVGGSVFGNAGCFGGEMKDVVESVEVLKIETPFSAQHFSRHGYFSAEKFLVLAPPRSQGLEKHSPSTEFRLNNKDCQFSYRHSIFKQHPEWIILGATLKLQSVDPKESRAKILEYTKKRASTQDIGSQCAGCIFKNFTPLDGGAVIPAGYLIDAAGLKGKTVGKAMVSEKHANYIVNTGGASANDVKNLIEHIKDRVQKVHGILLEEEIRIV